MPLHLFHVHRSVRSLRSRDLVQLTYCLWRRSVEPEGDAAGLVLEVGPLGIPLGDAIVVPLQPSASRWPLVFKNGTTVAGCCFLETLILVRISGSSTARWKKQGSSKVGRAGALLRCLL